MIKESFQIVGKTDDEIDKLKSLRIGLHMVDAQNFKKLLLATTKNNGTQELKKW